MKRFYTLFTMLLLCLCTVSIYGTEITVNGLTFTINSAGKAEVLRGDTVSGDVVIPSSIRLRTRSIPMVAIGDIAFSRNTNITSVKIPSSVVKIGVSAFSRCYKLADVSGGATRMVIEKNAFSYTPWAVSLRDEYGFAYWKNWLISANNFYQLDEYHIAEGTIGICEGTLKAKTVYLPKSFKAFPPEMLSVEKVVVDSENPDLFSDDYGAVYQRNAKGAYFSASSVSMKEISGQALIYVPDNKETDVFRVADGVDFLQSDACKNATFESMIVPEGCRFIPSDCISGLKRCEYIELPSTIEYFDMTEPKGSTSMEIVLKAKKRPDNLGNGFYRSAHITLYVPNDSLYSYQSNASFKGKFKDIKPISFSLVENDITYSINSDNKAEVSKGSSATGDVVIPSFVRHREVVTIGQSAFEKNTWITSVVLPPTITKISSFAFMNCTNLTSVMCGAENIKLIRLRPFDGTPWVESLPKDNNMVYWKNWIIHNSSYSRLDEYHVKEGTIGVSADRINVNTLYLPASFSYIDPDLFSVQKFVVDNANPNLYSDEYGAVYARKASDNNYSASEEINKDITGTALIAVPRVSTEDVFYVASGIKFLQSYSCSYGNFEKIIVPEGCEVINGTVLSRLERCKYIELPSTIKYFDLHYPTGDANMGIVLRAKEVPDNPADFSTFLNCSHVTLYVPAESLDKYLANKTYQDKFKAIKAIPDGPALGDVNGDGVINSADVVSVYNYIVSGLASGVTISSADINRDNTVNSSDVVEIYNLIVNGAASSPKFFTGKQ